MAEWWRGSGSSIVLSSSPFPAGLHLLERAPQALLAALPEIDAIGLVEGHVGARQREPRVAAPHVHYGEHGVVGHAADERDGA